MSSIVLHVTRRVAQALMTLAMIGAALFLWIPPAAAAPTAPIVPTASTITEFHVSNVGVPQGITAGPDGNLWFTEFYDNVAGRITTKGASTLFTLNTLNSATYITNGPDGASRVWRVTTNGRFTAFPYSDSSGGYPYQITPGPDGNLWFTDRAREIVKMTPAGQFTSFTVPTTNASTDDIVTGPDGNLWFTLDGSDVSRIGRITPSGAITLFTLPTSNDYLYMSGISAGPDGNLWFTYQDFTTKANAIGRITTSGTVTLTPTPSANSSPTDITPGADGNMWFTEASGNVGRITTH